MSHSGVAGYGQSGDVASLHSVFFQKCVNECINRVDYCVMNWRQSAAAAGKDHPRDNILTILRLLIMACLYSKGGAIAEIHQLGDNSGGTNVTGDTEVFCAGVPWFQRQNLYTMFIMGIQSRSSLPLVLPQQLSQSSQSGQRSFQIWCLNLFTNLAVNPVEIRDIVSETRLWQREVEFFCYGQVKQRGNVKSVTHLKVLRLIITNHALCSQYLLFLQACLRGHPDFQVVSNLGPAGKHKASVDLFATEKSHTVTGGFGLTTGNLNSAFSTYPFATAETVHINAGLSSCFKDAAFILYFYLSANRLKYHLVPGHSCLAFFF